MNSTKKEGLTSRLYIRYEMRYYRDGLPHDSPPDPVEAHVECALAALTHLEAMFDVLGFVRPRGLEDAEGGAETLENFAALGQRIASEAYCHIMEIPDAIKRREAGRE